MRNVYMKDANAAGFFNVFCDGTTAISVKKQMSIYENKAVYEAFLGFKELHATTGEGIAKNLPEVLSYGPHLENMQSQGYDECTSMKGKLMVYKLM